MLDHPNPPTAAQALEAVPPRGAAANPLATRVGDACGHERVHGERHHATCPSCGQALHSFLLYRDLVAQR